MWETLQYSWVETQTKDAEHLNKVNESIKAKRYYLSQIIPDNFVNKFLVKDNDIEVTWWKKKTFNQVMIDIATKIRPNWSSSRRVSGSVSYIDKTLLKVIQATANQHLAINLLWAKILPIKSYIWSKLKRSKWRWMLDVDWRMWQHTLEFARNYIARGYLSKLNTWLIKTKAKISYSEKKQQFTIKLNAWWIKYVTRDEWLNIKKFVKIKKEITDIIKSA